ncbi:MAG: lysine--tRNA ligase [Gammaproteobacteria bacterium]
MTDTAEQDHQDENKLIALRREKLDAIRLKRHPFPNDFRREDRAAELIDAYESKSKEELESLAITATVAGRVVRMRGPFTVIQDGDSMLQLYMSNKTLSEDLAEELRHLDLGDIIGASGVMFKTGKDELTLRVNDFRLLTKALRPLPDKHKGLADTELRYRQRYVDLIVNEETRDVFMLRSRLLKFVREYFEARDFIEVETPMMQIIPGGATARPFVTHHNSLDQDMYLRVAPELFLKRLIVGGLDRVFELNRNFRNEGLSTRHNPEFTMLEFYQAYATYEDLMDLSEDLLRSMARQLLGSTTLQYQGIEFEFGQPFERLTVNQAIVRYCRLDDDAVLTGADSVPHLADSLEVSYDSDWPTGKIIMEIFEQKVEHQLVQPTFITQYPTDVSPLARRNESNPDVTDRFELIIGGREVANGFSELNDPEDQAERFHAQVAQKESGDAEAMHFDEDYIRALEYGMPPTAGEGIGIDRLVMLFTDSPSIKDVLLFPHMRPE